MSVNLPIPNIRFSSWDNHEPVEPVGVRHLVSGSFAYISELGTGCDSALSFTNLRLDVATQSVASSDVAVVNFAIPNFPELVSSGISSVNNFRLWLPEGSGTVTDLDGISIEYQLHSNWRNSSIYTTFPSGAGATFSGIQPTTYNITRIDGSHEITGYDDDNVSQWIYLRAFLDQEFPVGSYGVCGSGLMRLRLTYDFY